MQFRFWKKKKQKNIMWVVASVMMIVFSTASLSPFAYAAQVLQSTNYQIINPEFSSGGAPVSSTNYSTLQTIGAPDAGSTASTNYNGIFGFLFQAYPGIPGTPTLTNSTGLSYGSLSFVIATGNNKSDVNYAIAISSNGFATTQYVQANDTIGSSAVWQTYSAWGGSGGQTISGLSASTTYTIKVKARYGINTETEFSGTASATTVGPSITFTNSNNTSGFGTLTSGAARYANSAGTGSASDVTAHTLTIVTNASTGYALTYNGATLTSGSNTIPAATITASSTGTTGTAQFAISAGAPATGTVQSAYLNQGSSSDNWKFVSGATTTLASSTGPVTSDAIPLHYLANISSTTPAGSYSTTITYIATGNF